MLFSFVQAHVRRNSGGVGDRSDPLLRRAVGRHVLHQQVHSPLLHARGRAGGGHAGRRQHATDAYRHGRRRQQLPDPGREDRDDRGVWERRRRGREGEQQRCEDAPGTASGPRPASWPPRPL